MIKTNKITHLLPVFCIINLNIVSWTLLCYFPQSFIRVWFFWESRLQHKCTWWLQVLWKFWIFLKFWNLFKISEFSLIDDEVQVFRINIKLSSNPVAELKFRENDSHCRSIVLIVKQLEKEKNSNFKVENFVVMFIYWGTIIIDIISFAILMCFLRIMSYNQHR
jgi:hypothetical protein